MRWIKHFQLSRSQTSIASNLTRRRELGDYKDCSQAIVFLPVTPLARAAPKMRRKRISGTDVFVRWCVSGDDGPYNLEGDIQVGDLAASRNKWQMVVSDQQGLKWVDVKSGARYPGDGLPNHILRLRPGKNPNWVQEKKLRHKTK